MKLDSNWFVEEVGGLAVSIKIRDKVHDEQSAYQHIEVYETEAFGYLLTLDGATMLTSRDNFIYHEMLSHPALFTHSDPKNVVIVGGGDCGTLREVLKHPEVKEVTLVELDERVTRVSEKFFPELCESNSDPRVQFHFGDGIQWMAEARAESVDVIALDTTDPVGHAARLFSPQFYRDCLNVLRVGGIVVAQSESPILNLELIKNIRLAMAEAGAQDIMTLSFPQCTYPSGWWSVTMARKGQGFDGFREADAMRKSFETRYYNAKVHAACLVLPEFMQEAFREERQGFV
ncbi:MAG: polyamine aminopropyltransferase [Gammaproteobacteria bacterium]|nr:polyamine aminopropyltransferase [Gammaproteobacteria bacterium]MCI0591529.1 polyamine aminopropyltransferase [Gammaproteobacteria bacterium]